MKITFGEASVDGVRATHADWQHKASIVQAPTQMDFGFTFVAEDPDGHRPRVFSPAANPRRAVETSALLTRLDRAKDDQAGMRFLGLAVSACPGDVVHTASVRPDIIARFDIEPFPPDLRGQSHRNIGLSDGTLMTSSNPCATQDRTCSADASRRKIATGA